MRVGPALTLLGGASYSIYLVHSPVLGYTAKTLQLVGLITRLPGWLVMVVVVVTAVAAGILFHLWVERPLTVAAQRATGRLLLGTGTRIRAREHHLQEACERLAGQEQTIAHLAASSCSTALAERQSPVLHRSLYAILERRRGGTERHGNTSITVAPGQLGL